MDKLRALIADDHAIFRHGLRAMLDATDDITVVGEARSGEEAIAMVAEMQPSIVLMDLQMPGMNGIEATRTLARAHPDVRVLMLTMFEDDASVFAAMRAGARGYVLKDAERDEVLRAIRAVCNGEAIFSPSVANRVIAFFAHPRPVLPAAVFPELTEREREILDRIARGENNERIAAFMALSSKTVSNYISSIFAKLQVADRAQAIVRARQAGLGQE